MELDKFWTKEITRAIEALKKRRVDPTDVERWKNFHANIKKATESWKVQCDFPFLCYALLTGRNALFRPKYQVILLKPYVAAMDARLRFAYFRFYSVYLYIDCV
jgi:hypothetical protein